MEEINIGLVAQAPSNARISDVLRAIEESQCKICFIFEPTDRRVIGTITDGDVRRSLLAGYGIDEPASSIVNRSFAFFRNEDDMRLKSIEFLKTGRYIVPVLNEDDKICQVWQINNADIKDVPIVIMAGGLGLRMRPLTDQTPKPMLLLNGVPILERIILKLRQQGFHKFIISVNYLKEKIISHFNDGAKFGVSIEYLYESKKLGTAGALWSISNRKFDRVIVMNGDILTDLDFSALANFSYHQRADFVSAVRRYDYQIPFGVVEVLDNKITKIDEKPIKTHYINSGIYVLSRTVLETLNSENYLDMPDLINCISDDFNVLAYEMNDLWYDIGRPEDLKNVSNFVAKYEN